ncbi:orc1/cdc6 family replication initiation protein [Halosimplex halobium]|uniref:orc1/cdc6 family replication initiation protein n=1 Tax=Halosimplex halobium TaxID=3396618 RepID=UPI003F55CB59
MVKDSPESETGGNSPETMATDGSSQDTLQGVESSAQDQDDDDEYSSQEAQHTPAESESDDPENTSISIRERFQESSSTSVFVDKDLVRPSTIIDEDRIVGRDKQLERVIDNLRPALEGGGLPNMLLNGPSGTGKSLIINAVCKQVVDLCQSQDVTFGVVSLNCEAPKSLDRAVYRLVGEVADDVGAEVGVPESGVSTDRKFERLFELINENYDAVIFILDEIDLLKGPYDDPAYSSLLYQLSRAENLGNIEGSVSVTALTNYTNFMQDLNSRAESSYNPDDIFFDDYDANQLRAILRNRKDAFKDGALTDDVVPLVAAFGSQTHGDARKAIDLFRWAGEFAERRGSETVEEEDVRSAQDKYDENRTLRHISGLATQKKLALYATAAVESFAKRDLSRIPAGVGWEIYKFVADRIDADQYSRETYVNNVTEQETYGILSSERRGRGRGRGVHMFFTLEEGADSIIQTIESDSRIGDIESDHEMLRSVVRTKVQAFYD